MKNEKICLRIISKMFQFYNTETTEAMKNGYFEELKEEEIEDLEKMEKYFIRTSAFMPKLSEILEYITKLKNENYNKKMIEDKNSERVDDLIDIADILKDFLKKIK